MGRAHRIRRYFVTGLLLLVPAWGTLLIIETLFYALDGLIVDLFGPSVKSDIPGLGLLSLVLLIFLVGAIATQLVGQRVLRSAEKIVGRIPFVNSIYVTLKGMTDLLSFNSRFGESPVVVFSFPRNGLWALGFMMGPAPEPVQMSAAKSLVSVFVPTAIHPLTGYLAFIPGDQMVPVNLSPKEAMKVEVSAGLYKLRADWLSRPELPGLKAGRQDG